jgi:hypothetical protein
MFTEIFPNAHGVKLVVVVFASCISLMCVGAFLHSIYELWASQQPKKKVYELDEFADRDDPFAVALPKRAAQSHITPAFAFESAVELAMWITGNITNEFRQELLMSNALQHKKLHGTYVITMELTEEEKAWVL